jgi:steroid delta-isomerase-like uncharacterized protein
MSVEENMRVIEAAFEAFNARDWDRFDELHAESLVVSGPDSPEPVKGRPAHREWAEGLVTAFPDIRVERQRAFGAGDWVCEEIAAAGTHNGPLKGPGDQTIPATGKLVRLTFCAVTKVEGGQITEEHGYYDRLGMMAQLGLAP